MEKKLILTVTLILLNKEIPYFKGNIYALMLLLRQIYCLNVLETNLLRKYLN